MPQNIQLPMQARAAAFMPSSVNEENRTVDVVFTTGAMVRRYDWMRDAEYEEELLVSEAAMRMERMRSGANLLADHNAYDIDDVLGVVERAWIEGGKGYASVRFARDEETEIVWQKVKDGILRSISVGYTVHAYQEIIEGQRRILRAIDWEPMEISLVAVPADAQAQVRSKPNSLVPCLVHRTQIDTTNGATMEPTTAAAAPAATEETTAAATEPQAVEPADDAANAAAETETRALEIMELCTLAGQPLMRAMDYVRGGKTVAEVRAALMQARDAKIAGETEISSHVQPPAEQKTGGTAERMRARVAKGHKAGGASAIASRMSARFSA